ncbi:hypothetical protein NCCP1664_16660 [Zafaria cholistanensis]|uniref:Uncharacterized protein n=1 Tax=Zafaria cholistanensis TaxID=1682741 RepID=A0A5A7NQU4_9MICC|nr:hypothetical protein NCCP1664_16660 [Zafaria cholistanensis]
MPVAGGPVEGCRKADAVAHGHPDRLYAGGPEDLKGGLHYDSRSAQCGAVRGGWAPAFAEV